MSVGFAMLFYLGGYIAFVIQPAFAVAIVAIGRTPKEMQPHLWLSGSAAALAGVAIASYLHVARHHGAEHASFTDSMDAVTSATSVVVLLSALVLFLVSCIVPRNPIVGGLTFGPASVSVVWFFTIYGSLSG